MAIMPRTTLQRTKGMRKKIIKYVILEVMVTKKAVAAASMKRLN